MAYSGAAGYKAERFDDRIPQCIDAIVEVRPQRFLDIGCGDGFLMELVRAHWPSVQKLVGLEVSEEAAEVVRAKGWECAVQSADQPMPFADASFDCVFAGEVIEHLADPDGLLAEIHRVLAPGGTLILTTPNLAAWFNRALLLFGITPMFVEHSYRATYGPAFTLLRRVGKPVGHLRIFTWTPLREVLCQNGFSIVHRRSSGCLPVPVLHQVDKAIARVVPSLGANFIVTAQKKVTH